MSKDRGKPNVLDDHPGAAMEGFENRNRWEIENNNEEDLGIPDETSFLILNEHKRAISPDPTRSGSNY